MSKSNDFENDLILLIFNATAIANLADNASSSPLTNLFVALHTGDPGEAGTQVTSEATYTSYGRATVARTSGGWTVVANAMDNAAAISFVTATGGSEDITHFSIGKVVSGASEILYKAALDATLSVSSGITPEFAIGACNVTED